MPEEDIVETLRQLPLKTIVNASRTLWKENNDNVIGRSSPLSTGRTRSPTSESAPWRYQRHRLFKPSPSSLTSHLVLAARAVGLRIPVLTGFNTDEGAVFIPPKANTNAEFRLSSKRSSRPLPRQILMRLRSSIRPHGYLEESLIVPSRRARESSGRGSLLSTATMLISALCYKQHISLSTAGGGANTSKDKAPVYVYHFAATGNNGVTNHGDEATPVAHDMTLLGNKDLVGLRAHCGCYAWSFARFVVSLVGNLNTGVMDGAEWPVFESPISREDKEGSSVVERVAKEGKDKLMLFGDGNDERRGSAGASIQACPPRSSLGEVELEACQFWWSRIELAKV